MSQPSPRNRRRRARGGEDAQAVVETALVIPLLLVVLLLFVGAVLLAEAVNEVRTATTVATVSAFSAPAGAPAQALAAVNDSYQQSINSSDIAQPTISCPQSDGNQYLYTGAAQRGTYVSCHGSGTVDFSHSIVGIVWRFSVTVRQDARVPVPLYRQCAPGTNPC
jgi:Flp pilus assembly protein TadG